MTDIRGKECRFGRDAECEYVFKKEDGIEKKVICMISQIHFVLKKMRNDDESPIIIKDCSVNGTLLNGEMIGKNKQRIIRTGDVISILVSKNLQCKYLGYNLRAEIHYISFLLSIVFDFQELIPRKHIDLPKEVQTQYFVDQQVGSGAYGQVFKILDRNLNPFAVKYIKARNMHATKVSENEINIMKSLSHICIMSTIEIIKDESGSALILDFMEGGDLLHRIIKSPEKRISEDSSRCFLYQIAEAIKYLHSKGITHRDLKPDNILLKDNKDITLLKITDFGLSKMITSPNSFMKTRIGTPNYTAPEVLRANNTADTAYTHKIDIWSMGVVLFCALSGTFPFCEEFGDVKTQIILGRYQFLMKYWKGVSHDAMRLVRKMLVVNPEDRIDIDNIFKSKWMTPTTQGVMYAKEILDKYATIPLEQHHQRKIKSHESFCDEPPTKRLRHKT